MSRDAVHERLGAEQHHAALERLADALGDTNRCACERLTAGADVTHDVRIRAHRRIRGEVVVAKHAQAQPLGVEGDDRAPHPNIPPMRVPATRLITRRLTVATAISTTPSAAASLPPPAL